MPEFEKRNLEYIANKARSILKGRKRKELDYAIKTVNWIMEMADINNDPIEFVSTKSPSTKDREIPAKSVKIEIGNDETNTSAYYSPAMMLLNEIGKYDISNQTEFPNAIYAEYFAIMALAIIEVLIKELKNPMHASQIGDEDPEINKYYCFNHFLLNAMEAVSFAEIFNNQEKLKVLVEKGAKKQISLRNQEAAIKRHEITNEIKEDFREFYLENLHLTKAAAARNFYKELSEYKKGCLSEDNVERFLVNSIKDIKKN
ncbi:hypothetical protein J2S31_000339 [Nitrospina gracilis Nb-211]|nr:hypothetical protein [Nitrospina gracilis Nb-211]